MGKEGAERAGGGLRNGGAREEEVQVADGSFRIDESYCYSKRQGMFKEYSTCLPADVCQVTFLHE